MHSPLSQLPPEKIRDLPKDFLLEKLQKYFQATPPPGAVEADYSLWRCAETGLEFCEPPLPGNARFYDWISSFKSYYPGYRWEYGEVAAKIKSSDVSNEELKVMDVGSGKGDFLDTLDFLPAEKKTALDFNESAIAACRDKGFRAYGGTVENAIASDFIQKGEFAIVTSFHCLEHVCDPVEFVRGLLSATKSGGRVFVSTPYSPMSFESEWFDVMNHPPHHMTRWNLSAYEKLAETLGVKMQHYNPATNSLKQALQLFQLKTYEPNTPVSLFKSTGDIIRNLSKFLHDWRQLFRRTRDHKIGGANSILIEFTAS